MSKLNLVFFLSLMILLSVVPISAQTDSSEQVQSVQVNIDFSRPISVEEAIQFADESNLKPSIFESSFVLGSTTYHDFYIVNPGDPMLAVKSGYVENRSAFLADMVDLVGKLSAEDRAELGFQADFVAATGAQDISQIYISKATLLGDPKDLQQLMQKKGAGIIANIEVENISQKEDQESIDNSAESAKVTNAAASTWYPNSGVSYAYASAESGRYTSQFMKWSRPSFATNQTYEHDYFLDNYDEKTYLNSASTIYPSCFPVTLYATTSWPASSKPYLDTRFNVTSCEKNELAFTIGAAQADQLQVNTMYQNYIRTSNGNIDKDRFKLQAQLGHRTPSYCYTTWCSFGDSIINLVQAWDNAVPGTREWGNWALGKYAIASSTQFNGVEPNKAFDGNLSTRWSSAQGSDPQWIYVDLGNNYTFSKIVLQWEVAYAKRYGIYIWNGSNWQNVFWTDNGDGGLDNISINSVNARWVMMYGVQRGTQYGYSLWEFEVYRDFVLGTRQALAVNSEIIPLVEPPVETKPAVPNEGNTIFLPIIQQ